MDRRMLLALALSALVIIFFNFVISPPPPAPTPIPTPPALEGVAGGDSSGFSGTAPTGELRAAPVPQHVDRAELAEPGLNRATTEARTRFTTEFLDVTFTNRGGMIASCDLPQFAGPEDRVHLVRGDSEFGLLIETSLGFLDTRNVLFSSRESSGPSGERRVVFQAGNPGGLELTKTFTVPAEGYLVTLDIEVRGAGEAATGYQLMWEDGLPVAEKSEKPYLSSGGTIALLGNSREKEGFGSFKRQTSKELEGNVRWAGVRNKYFAAIMIPPASTSTRVVATGSNELKITGARLVMPLVRGAANHPVDLYLGPLDFDRLKSHDQGLELAVDLGFKIFRPVSQLLLVVMNWMYKFIPNYGWVIVILSVLTKVLFYPLTRTSLRSMKAMQQLQPEVAALKEKHKSNPQQMQKEMMALYKEKKVNPMGGCLPILVQMPVFIGLYQVLANSIAMRGAHFLLWMDDLSTPETIFSVGGFPLHVLPVIMFLATFLQQKLTPTADQRQKMMGYMMPLVMLFIFYGFPAGLNLYWTVNNILTVAQHWWVHRDAPAGTPAPHAA